VTAFETTFTGLLNHEEHEVHEEERITSDLLALPPFVFFVFLRVLRGLTPFVFFVVQTVVRQCGA